MNSPFNEAVKARLETVSAVDGTLKVPVDLNAIAKQLGVLVGYTPLAPNIGGFILQENHKTAAIYVNSNDSERRQRFTLAHELGHFWMHRDDKDDYGYVENRDELSTRGTDPNERWANSFAAELLMPARYIRMAWARGDSIQQIQDALNVSDAALGHRLVNLGLIAQ